MAKEIIFVESCKPATGKSGKPYHKLNNKFYIWEKEIGRLLEDNIGKSFEMEVDKENSQFPKVLKVFEEADKPVELVKINPAWTNPAVKAEIIDEINDNIILVKKEKPNSYEFGKAGNRFKVYFDTAEDLAEQVNALMEMQNNLFPTE